MNLAELTLSGTVTDIGVREGTSAKGPYRITTAYLVGTRRSYAVTLPDHLVGTFDVGDDVCLVVYARVYNGQVDFGAVEHAATATRAAA